MEGVYGRINFVNDAMALRAKKMSGESNFGPILSILHLLRFSKVGPTVNESSSFPESILFRVHSLFDPSFL